MSLKVKSYSISRDNDYGRCPHLFKRKNLDKIDLGKPNVLTQVGLDTHDYFKMYYQKVDIKQLQKLDGEDLYDYIVSFFKTNIPDKAVSMVLVPVIQGFADMECERIAILKQKKVDFKRYYLPVYVERKRAFKVVFKHENEGKVYVIETTFRIKPDAVFLDYVDDSHIILDWKTGYRKAEFYDDANHQLYVYAHYLEARGVKDKFGNVICAKSLCLVFPRRSAVIYKLRKSGSEKLIFRALAKRLYMVATAHFDRKMNMWNCCWDKPAENQCTLWELECKAEAIRQGLYQEARIVKVRTQEEVEDEIPKEDDDDDFDDEEEAQNKNVRDFSEGSWSAVSEDDMG